MRAFSIFAMVLALLWAGPVAADDVTLELGAEDDFVVHDASGNDRLRVDTSAGAVKIGGGGGLEYETDGVCAGGSSSGALCVTDVECSGGGTCNILGKNSVLFTKPVSLLDRDPDGNGFDDGPGDDLIGSTRLQLRHTQTSSGDWLMTDNVLCLLFNYADCGKSNRIDTNFAGAAFQWEFLFQAGEPFTSKGMEVIFEASDAGGFLDRFMMYHVDTNATDFPTGAGTFYFWPNGQDSGNATLKIHRKGLEVRGGYLNRVSPPTVDLDNFGIAVNMDLTIRDNGVSTEMRTLKLGHEFSMMPGLPSVDTVRTLLLATPRNISEADVSNHASILIDNQLGMGTAGQSNVLWIRPQTAGTDDDQKGNVNLEGGDAGSGHVTFGPGAALGHLYYDRAASNFASELSSTFTGQLCINKAQAIGGANRSVEMCDDSAAVVLSQAGDGAISGPGVFWAVSDGSDFDTGTEVCRAHGLLCRTNGVYDHGNVAIGSAAAITRSACGSAISSGSDFTVFCVAD